MFVCVLVTQSCPTFCDPTNWTPRAVAHEASLSIEFSRQEYWSGLPFSSPEGLPDLGIEPWSPALQMDSLPFELQRSPEVLYCYRTTQIIYFIWTEL